MADQGPVVRVRHADGHVFNMKEREAAKYVEANPGAAIIGRRRVHDDSELTPQEISANEAQAAGDGDDLAGKSKADLVALAEAQGVDATGTKADLVARLTAARDAGQADGQAPDGGSENAPGA